MLLTNLMNVNAFFSFLFQQNRRRKMKPIKIMPYTKGELLGRSSIDQIL